LGVGYDTVGEEFVRLYQSRDGREFQPMAGRLFATGRPNETALAFLPDETAVCLLRRDGEPGTAQMGRARPPYTDWQWKDLGVRIGGPALVRLPDGRLVAAGRLYDGGARTSLLWLEAETGRLEECARLPSGGDCSYPGLVWRAPVLWVSYYSSHEGKATIYLAKVRPGPPGGGAK
jgi:hypothetical protein